ncbi:MAG: hypothetical protein IJ722_01385 [Alloprevotella sp.]|nr:hypothetical protein [Alloprevotella sp.]
MYKNNKYSKFFMAALTLLCVSAFSSCSNDDDNNSSAGLNGFEVRDAVFSNEGLPSATSAEQLSGVTVEESPEAGSEGVITVISSKPYARFFIGVEGVPSRWTWTPVSDDEVRTKSPRATDSETYEYSIPVRYGNGSETTIVINAEDMNGKIMRPYKSKIQYATGTEEDSGETDTETDETETETDGTETETDGTETETDGTDNTNDANP